MGDHYTDHRAAVHDDHPDHNFVAETMTADIIPTLAFSLMIAAGLAMMVFGE
jgi:hypothetical protein